MGNTINEMKKNAQKAIKDEHKSEIKKFFELAKTKEKLLLSEFKQQGTVTKQDFDINIHKVTM